MIEITVRAFKVDYKSDNISPCYFVVWAEGTPDEFTLDGAIAKIRSGGYTFSAWDDAQSSSYISVEKILVYHFSIDAFSPNYRDGVMLSASTDRRTLYEFITSNLVGIYIKDELMLLLDDDTKVKLVQWRLSA